MEFPPCIDPNTGKSIADYPKMFYHPKGETEVVSQGEVQVTPSGPQLRNAQRRLINKIANNKAEEDELRKEGWHDHPSKAVAAAKKAA